MSDCERFVAGEHRALFRAAFLLTGSDASAQDLVQETLLQVVVHWRKIARADEPQAYVRRMLVNAFLSGRRRAWHGEVPHDVMPEGHALSPYAVVDEQDELHRALLALPARQRAAVVLRHYEDRPEAETARLMGCSVGTVKSLTSRGLASLRTVLTDDATTSGTASRGTDRP